MAALLLATTILSGCFGGSGEFEASATQALQVPGYAYDGRGIRSLEGRVDADLNPKANDGQIIAQMSDVISTYEVRWTNFTGRHPYQSDGVAAQLWMWGNSGNGSTVFPKVFVHAAAFGRAAFYEDGRLQRDPSNLGADYEAYFFVTRGQYRDNDTLRVMNAAKSADYQPSRPDDANVNLIGSQAVILLYAHNGQLYRHYEFRQVAITKAL